MKKINKINWLALFCIFLFLSKNSPAQTTALPEKSLKTVVYKIKKRGEQNSLSAKQVIDIDKLLVSKKGILSSVTNGANRTVSVKLESNFPEEEIKKLLGSIFNLEVESFETIDNKK
ncbi:MAG TPA: hypothetical protein VNZ49_14830 [Bacteroidia bacterium]|nr:hypothetical protein [Bacteroidia bacterium]